MRLEPKAGFAVALVAGLAFVGAQAVAGNAPSTPAPGQIINAGTTGIPPGLLEKYAVLRRTRQAADQIPEKVLSRTSLDRESLGWSRRLSAESGGTYVVPTTDGLCVVRGETGLTFCHTEQEYERAGAAILQVGICGPGQPAGRMIVHGLIHDGVEQIGLLTEAGSAVPLPIRDNYVHVELPVSTPPTTALQWVESGDKRSVESPIPPRLADEPCSTPAEAAAQAAPRD